MVNKKSRFFVFLILFIVIIIASAVGLWLNMRQQVTAPLKLTVGIQNDLAPGLILIAKNQGYFDEENLQVDLTVYASGKLAADALFRDEVEVATVTDVIISTQAQERNDFSVLSTITKIHNPAKIIARRDKGINIKNDLAGKVIGTQKNSGVHFFLSQFLTYNNIPQGLVLFKYYSPEQLPNALATGEIDAFSMREPYMSEAKKLMGANNLVEFEDDTIYTQYFNLISKNTTVNNQPEKINRLFRALKKAQLLYLKNPDIIDKIIKDEFLQDIQPQMSLVKKNYQYKVTLDQSLIWILEDLYRWQKNFGLNTKSAIPNYLDYINLSFLNTLSPNDITIIK